jgi:hypothetical protein
VRAGIPHTSENRLVLPRDLPPCEVAERIVDFWGQVGAAWILAGIQARLEKDEFYPRPRERGLGGLLG